MGRFWCVSFLVSLVIFCQAHVVGAGENLLENPSFEAGRGAIPEGWSRFSYGKSVNHNTHVTRVLGAADGRKAVMLRDLSASKKHTAGIFQRFTPKPGMEYHASVKVKKARGRSDGHALMQIRFFPGDHYAQVPLTPTSAKEYTEVGLSAVAPKNATGAWLLFYTGAASKPSVVIDDVRLMENDSEGFVRNFKLKNLHLETGLVVSGKPAAVIVADEGEMLQARQIVQAVSDQTGCELKILPAKTYLLGERLEENVIAIGNRNTNRFISDLYDRYYCLLDLRYPGKGGSVVRTLHNPLGDGHNVVLVGGSDADGIAKATATFLGALKSAAAEKGKLHIGRLMEIELGSDMKLPRALNSVAMWEASRGYGVQGFFGWNSLSKCMALYYMTGDEYHLKEFLRLAFPDKDAIAYLNENDQEQIHDKAHPLVAPYHYCAHLMAIYWDLIEESPFFSDADRKRITREFIKQFEHFRKDHGAGYGVYSMRSPQPIIGDRHAQWGAMSLYSVARYLSKDYGEAYPALNQAVAGVKNFYAPLLSDAAFLGHNDNLVWYCTALEPLINFHLLAGWKDKVNKVALQKIADSLLYLSNGEKGSGMTSYYALGLLRKLAYVMDDAVFLQLVKESLLDDTVPRLGQSFEPGAALASKSWDRREGKWSFFTPTRRIQGLRRGEIPFDPAKAFYFGAYRDKPDGSGDYVLVDGYFWVIGRNPFHCFSLLQLRLDGVPLTGGYGTQLYTRSEGTVAKQQPFYTRLDGTNVLGESSLLQTTVLNQNDTDVTRTLLVGRNRYALCIDQLKARKEISCLDADVNWNLSNAVRKCATSLQMTYSQPPSNELTFGIRNFYPSGRNLRNVKILDGLDTIIYKRGQPGDWLEVSFTLDNDIDAQVDLQLLNGIDRGKIKVEIDGQVVLHGYSQYAENPADATVSLGRRKISAGRHRLRLTLIEKHGDAKIGVIGLKGLRLTDTQKPADKPGEKRFHLSMAGVDELALQGQAGQSTIAKGMWSGRVKKGQKVTVFTLIGKGHAGSDRIVKVADNAAVVQLPETALAVTGEFDGVEANTALFSKERLYGYRLRACGDLLVSSVPVNVEWDFVKGVMLVQTDELATLTVAVRSDHGIEGAGCKVFGENRVQLELPKGQTRITGITPPADLLSAHEARCIALRQAQLQKGRVGRSTSTSMQSVAALPARWKQRVKGFAADIVGLVVDGTPAVAVAHGKEITLIRQADGAVLRTFQADGAIRVLRYWPEAKLLLAGCVDEKVIAFRLNGTRKWVFVSQIAPEVLRYGTYYWYKTQVGHNGIHALHTGTFLNGKTQAFIGSACTMEIVDADGQLVRRLVYLWGPVSTINLVPAPDGKRVTLMGARKLNGRHCITHTDNRSLSPQRGFYGVPAGHTYIGGWMSMCHNRILCEDLDGDGTKEIVSDIDGIWNRIQVWALTGHPIADVSFGPGQRTRSPLPLPGMEVKNMRDMIVADINDDGKKEILAAAVNNIVIALDAKCQKVWVKKMASEPMALRALPASKGQSARILVALRNGDVVRLDAAGRITARGGFDGVPVKMISPNGIAIVIGDTGGVEAYDFKAE